MSTPEGKIQLAICKHLRKQGVFFWRSNNQPTYDPKMNSGRGGYRSQGEYAISGVPDIIAISKDGQFIGLEVKTPKGKQSTEQIFFQKRCERIGAQYHVVRSVDDVDNLGL